MDGKIIIYQVLPRWFGNDDSTNKENGTIADNGVGKFSTFDTTTLNEIKAMGFTHLWYTGILEHATKTDYSLYDIRGSHPDIVKGNAGSPYAIRDYYDVAPDLADNVMNRIAEFEAMLERTHACGLKAIIDFVPNHVAREYFSDIKSEKNKNFGSDDDLTVAFSPNNNFYYIPNQPLELQFHVSRGHSAYSEYPAKVSGNDRFDSHPTEHDWYEAVKLNYGVDYLNNHHAYFDPIPDTWLKMLDILLYWTGKGVDGFRCDMAEMVPVDFWHWVIPQIKAKNGSVIFIAEIYNPAQYHSYVYRGHFDYLYDKVGLYDTLRDVICGYRPASVLTNCWQNVEGLQDRMLNFLENHDEQRIASDFFAKNPSKGLPAMLVAATMNTNPVMIYAGQELGERGMDKEGFSGRDGRTTIFDYWSVDSIRAWRNRSKYDGLKLSDVQKQLRAFYIQLLQTCNKDSNIRSGKFYDLMYANIHNPQFDSNHQYAFLRCSERSFSLIVANFSDQAVKLHVHIPPEAFAYMNIQPSDLKEVNELLPEDNRQALALNWEKTSVIEVEAYSGKILMYR